MSTGLDYVRIAKGMRAQLALRKRRFEEGAKQAGWKVGLGAPAVMAKLGLAMPLVGFVLDRAVLPVNAAISIAGWQKPVAEAEIAAIMGRDLPEEADLQAVRSPSPRLHCDRACGYGLPDGRRRGGSRRRHLPASRGNWGRRTRCAPAPVWTGSPGGLGAVVRT
jgi:hypothetical protein